MDLTHHLYRLVLRGDLHLAPIPKDVQRVLDLGTGTGIWALDFAEYVKKVYVTPRLSSDVNVCFLASIHPRMLLGLI